MQTTFMLIRTTTAHPDFQSLVQQLDHELWNELGEDQNTYDSFNKVPDIKTAVMIYADGKPVACGCFKPRDNCTVEIKRMFVHSAYRGKGLSKQVLSSLERWAAELGNTDAVLETSIHFNTACALYHTSGYSIIPNYPPYEGLEESVCMKKQLIA